MGSMIASCSYSNRFRTLCRVNGAQILPGSAPLNAVAMMQAWSDYLDGLRSSTGATVSLGNELELTALSLDKEHGG